MIFDRAFCKLTPDERQALLGLAEVRRYRHGQVILDQGAMSQALYVIRRGEVRIQRMLGVVRETLRRLPDGTTERVPVPGRLAVDMLRLGAGSVIGEMSFVDDAATSARVVARGTVEILFIDGSRVREYLADHPEFGLRFYHSLAVVLSQRLRVANDRGRRKEADPSPGGDPLAAGSPRSLDDAGIDDVTAMIGQ